MWSGWSRGGVSLHGVGRMAGVYACRGARMGEVTGVVAGGPAAGGGRWARRRGDEVCGMRRGAAREMTHPVRPAAAVLLELTAAMAGRNNNA
jgi:hypothetical protein